MHEKHLSKSQAISSVSSIIEIIKKLELPSSLKVTQSILKSMFIIFLSSITFSLIDAVVRPIAKFMLG